MTKELIVTIGISGSGKSSWAAKMVQEAIDKYVVVNRDKIRELLFGYTEEGIKDYYFRDDLRKLEKQVNRYEDLLIKEALAQGKTPIIDATHLKREYLTRFKYWNVPVKLMWFDIELG
ncbi:MAG: AAA family ATPase, partial [Sphaerochaetaceae bacterium]|nr:AAA family ATPase [Sphaerochaetaceae bacterium]